MNDMIILDKKTMKKYTKPYDLIINTKITLINPHMFDMAEFAYTDQGRLVIIGNCNDIVELTHERFKLI